MSNSPYEVLLDPLGDRVCKSEPLPPIGDIKDNVLFSFQKEKPNWKIVKDFLRSEGNLNMN